MPTYRLAQSAQDDLTDRPLRFFPLYSYLIIYLDGTMPVQVVRILSSSRDLAALLEG